MEPASTGALSATCVKTAVASVCTAGPAAPIVAVVGLAALLIWATSEKSKESK